MGENVKSSVRSSSGSTVRSRARARGVTPFGASKVRASRSIRRKGQIIGHNGHNKKAKLTGSSAQKLRSRNR